MKTPVQRRPTRISGNVDVTSKEGLSRLLLQMREGLNFLLDSTSTTGVATKVASNLAIFGQNVVDATGNLLETVGSAQIAAGAITEDHLSDNSINGDALQPGSVDGGHINAGAVDGSHVSAGTLTDDHVVDDQSLVASGGVTVDPATGALQIDLSVSAAGSGSGVETVINNDTAYANDGAGLGATADLVQTQNLPPDVATAAVMGLMVDAQPSIGMAAADGEVLRGYASTGTLGFDTQYHGESDSTGLSGTNFMPGGNLGLTGSVKTIGNALVITNPGGFISLNITANISFSSGGAAGDAGNFQIIISTDGGATFNSLSSAIYGVVLAGKRVGAPVQAFWSGTPTGDIWLEVQGNLSTGTGPLTVQAATSSFGYKTFATSNGNAVGATALGVTIASAASMACTKNYPSTTCAASKNISFSVQGGLWPNTSAAAKTAGTGTVSGSSSNPFTVSDTETTADGGATHTTTVNVKVTDSQTYTMTPASESGTTVTGTLNLPGLIPVGGKFDVTGGVPSGYNGTGRTALSGTTGTTLKYTSGSSGLGALSTPATISNVNVTSSNCVLTATFTRIYSNVTVAINGSKSGNCAAHSGTCTVTLSLSQNPSGGDQSYPTRSNTKTAGSYTLGGSSSANFTCTESGSVLGGGSSDTGTVHCQATDGHGNVGSASATLVFTFNNLT